MSDGEALAFVDTNIFVYAVAGDADERADMAAKLIRQLVVGGRLRTSAQVLQEIFVTLTRKIERKLTPAAALHYIEGVAEHPVVGVDFALMRAAIGLTMKASISYWDALIVAAADRSGADILYTEDLRHNQKMLGVRIVNPFRKSVTQ